METKFRTEQPPMVSSTRSVIQLRSSSHRLAPTEAKMREYIENGTQLGWLIDPVDLEVHAHGTEDRVEISDKPDSVSGNPTFPGLVLDLRPISEPGS